MVIDSSTLSLVICFMIVTWFIVLRSNSARRKYAKRPPGPRPFPIIGNLLQLGQNPHQSLAKLSKTYGPLMSLQLGSIYTVVVSSPEIAKQVLQKQDLLFASRPISAAARVHGLPEMSMFYLPLGKQWRKLRKICREQMFSADCLDPSQSLRREKLRKLCDHVDKCSIGGRVVDVGQATFVTSLNLMSATLFSMEVTDFDADGTDEFRESFDGMKKIVSAPNVADFFPVLNVVDPQGIRRRAEFYVGKLLDMFEGIINQRLESRRTSIGYGRKNDLLEKLLDLRPAGSDEYELNRDEIKHLLLVLFMAGSDSTTSTVEWAMTELLLNPDKMGKAKNELRTVIGENKQVEESDIPRLPYLQALIKETLRYHPPGPFLIRKAEDDVEMDNYTIPKNTQIFVNVWAIGRDSSIWPNPSSFEPERFLDSEIDFKGQDFMLIPFGAGRRTCPGLPLADRMLHLMVASLIHNFDWKLEVGVELEEVDTSENFGGLSLHKAVPLKAIPIKV